MKATIGHFEFSLWMDAITARKILTEAILDAEGRPISSKPKFEKNNRKGEVCLVGYQGYKQHSPHIQAFAQSNAENFAQVLMFAPLTANTRFSRFTNWFPVLMKFLRTRDKISREEVVNFIAGIGGQRAEIEKGKELASITDLGKGQKSALISYVWSNREDLFKSCMEAADKGQFIELMRRFAMLPGVQPVKAGFIVQLLFGQLGCLDVHNIRLYSAVSDLMQKDPSLDSEERIKWAELKRMLDGGRIWAKGVGGKNNPAKVAETEAKMDRAIKAYAEVLNHMHQEMGINPRVLWDTWVNYVSQRYEGDPNNKYSREQGLAYAPDDPQMLGAFGGQDRQWKFGGKSANVIKPHPSSGAVSRVHLTAAITPDELLAQMDTQLGNKYHLINSALRSDVNAKPALQALAARIMDDTELQSILDSGEKIMAARNYAGPENKQMMQKLIENAKKALYFVLSHQPYGMNPRDAMELIEIYSTILKKNAKRHMGEIRQTLRQQQTTLNRGAGSHIEDDEEMGYGLDTYDTNKPFDPKDPYNKVDRLTNLVKPYLPAMKDTMKANRKLADLMDRLPPLLQQAKEQLAEGRKAKTQAHKLVISITAEAERTQATLDSLPTGGASRKQAAEKLAEINSRLEAANKDYEEKKVVVSQLKRKISRLNAQLAAAQKAASGNKNTLLGQGDAEIKKQKDKDRQHLHGLGATDDDEDEYEEED